MKLHFVLAWRLRAEASGGGQLSFRKVAPGLGAAGCAVSGDELRSKSLVKIAELGTFSLLKQSVPYWICSVKALCADF